MISIPQRFETWTQGKVIGLTGTRHGGTAVQLDVLDVFLSGARRLGHGGCIGVDAQGHALALRHWVPVWVYPPVDVRLRAFCKGAEVVMPEKEHLARNRDIVDACDVLVALPFELEEQKRGGTWYTVRCAAKVLKPFVILWPNGNVTRVPSG